MNHLASESRFRLWELGHREMGLHFETIGGIGPSDYQADFVDAYDNMADRILKLRFGRDYFQRLHNRAAADVYVHQVAIEGCYESSSHQVFTTRRETYWLTGSEELLAAASNLESARCASGRLVDRHSR